MRLIELRSEKLNNALALSFTAKEEMSWAPVYELDFVSPDPDVDLDSLLGDPIAVDIALDDGSYRTFHSYVLEGVDTGQKENQYTYKLKLGSWLSFLNQNQNCRIFQDLSVPEIVEQVFSNYGLAKYKFDLARTYDKREYCVQFKESDLAFVARLLEDEGIYYHIEHARDEHSMLISDTQTFPAQNGKYARMDFIPDGEEGRPVDEREGIQRLQRTRKVRPNAIVLRDFDYNVPSNLLQADAQQQQKSLNGVQLEYYDYAEGYTAQERGEFLAKLRLLAWQAEANILKGVSNAKGMSLGHSFTLQLHPDNSRNRGFFILSTKYEFVQDIDTSGQGQTVKCQFTALADDIEYHPLRRVAKPTVAGLQSATVVGPEGSEVHTDALGRIRVHFHWDRYTTTEENASCWIRVSQAWAGKGWGVIAMPRVGQEVVVSYVDGNLDRPLVSGVVYNGDLPPPYDLPKDIRYSGMVSRSLSEGQPQHASQITFDDTRNAERIMLHSERDYQTTVERNKSTVIGHDQYNAVKRTLSETTTNTITQKTTGYDITGNQVSHTTAAFSNVDTSNSYTQQAASVTGTQASFTGSSIGFTNNAITYTGEDITYYGKKTSYVGTNHLEITSSVEKIGAQINQTGARIETTGAWLRTTGACIDMTGVWGKLTGLEIDAKGMLVQATGSAGVLWGSIIEAKGSAIELNGSWMNVTGFKLWATGLSTKVTFTDIELGGLRLSTYALSIHN